MEQSVEFCIRSFEISTPTGIHNVVPGEKNPNLPGGLESCTIIGLYPITVLINTGIASALFSRVFFSNIPPEYLEEPADTVHSTHHPTHKQIQTRSELSVVRTRSSSPNGCFHQIATCARVQISKARQQSRWESQAEREQKRDREQGIERERKRRQASADPEIERRRYRGRYKRGRERAETSIHFTRTSEITYNVPRSEDKLLDFLQGEQGVCVRDARLTWLGYFAFYSSFPLARARAFVFCIYYSSRATSRAF